MVASIYLTNTAINSGVPVRLLCNGITPSYNKNIVVKPNANGDSLVEVQTQSYENPKYTISGININGGANTLTFDHLRTLYTQKYNGSNYITLNVTYGNGIMLNSLTGATSIPVVLEGSFSFPIDVTQTRDGYLPKIPSLIFRETA